MPRVPLPGICRRHKARAACWPAQMERMRRTQWPRARVSCGGREFAGKGAADKSRGRAAAEQRRKRAKARPLALPEQHLIERREPVAQRLEFVAFADLVHKS